MGTHFFFYFGLPTINRLSPKLDEYQSRSQINNDFSILTRTPRTRPRVQNLKGFTPYRRCLLPLYSSLECTILKDLVAVPNIRQTIGQMDPQDAYRFRDKKDGSWHCCGSAPHISPHKNTKIPSPVLTDYRRTRKPYRRIMVLLKTQKRPRFSKD